MKNRYFIRLHYQGASFHGWQKQPNASTVQEEIERAMGHLMGKPTEVIGAGRTDTGVHAREMWAHFDSENPLDTAQLMYRLNAYLHPSIGIDEIRAVAQDAHTRFSATSRSYEYHIHSAKDAFSEPLSWYIRRSLDTDLLDQAAAVMLEFTEFSSFARSNDSANHHFCTLMRSEWVHSASKSVYHVQANRFLRNMVRAMVGTMVEVAEGRYGLDELREVIRSGQRSRAGESAPPQGLFLTRVAYPEEVFHV